jgi:hypothetical protein
MCDFTDCEKWKELDCSQFRADIFLSPTCYRPLKSKKVSGSKVPCSVGLDGLVNHARHERDLAMNMAREAKGAGNSAQAVAWNHTVLAYDDMLRRLKAI